MSQHPQAAHTPLHDLHRRLGAHMVTFAGHALPLHYAAGIVAEHRHVRQAAGLFDVSHMTQVTLTGPDACALLESVTPADLESLPVGRWRYTVATNAEGGVVDDLIIQRLPDGWHVVGNAVRRTADLVLLREAAAGREVTITPRDDLAMLALQGPAADGALAALSPATTGLAFGDVARLPLVGVECIVSRSGYTGEDGFEIAVPAEAATMVAEALLQDPTVEPVGLGARDSLRVEAGLCLYGNELTEQVTPVEAGIAFTVARARRPGGARPGGFPGAEVIFRQLAQGAPRRRIGLLVRGRIPVRAGAVLTGPDGETVGRVTSGAWGATVERPVAMALVDARVPGAGELGARVRGRPVTLEIAALPFVAHRYRRRAGNATRHDHPQEEADE